MDRTTLDEADKQRVLTNIWGIVSNYVCQFQLRYTNWDITLDQKHKRLRIMFENTSRAARLTSSDDLAAMLIDLHRTKSQMMSDLVNMSMEAVKSYYLFAGKADVLPRSCVKVMLDDLVHDLFRFNSDPFDIKEDSALFSIYNGSERFVKEVDIPSKAITNSYFNNRLNNDKVKDFLAGKIHWRDCWEDGDKTSLDDSSFYQSTLIVPMTLVSGKNSMSPEAHSKLLGTGSLQGNHDKLLFGFLCLDHIETNFFEESDVHLAWFFSDLISLPVVSDLLVTDLSQTTQSVINYLIETPPQDLKSRLGLEGLIRTFGENNTMNTENEDDEKKQSVTTTNNFFGDVNARQLAVGDSTTFNVREELGNVVGDLMKNNAAACSALQELEIEIGKEEKNDSQLLSIWKKVIEAAPALDKYASTAEKVRELFQVSTGA